MNRGFTLIEVVLALAVAALVMAALGPALVGTLRAEHQARDTLAVLGEEPAAFAQLREDLMAAPQPVGTVAVPFLVNSNLVGGSRGDRLQVFSCAALPLHPQLAQRTPEVGQAVITWAVRRADDGRGLAWTRSRKADVLATGTTASPLAEVVLDHLALLTVEAFADGGFIAAYDSSARSDALPLAVRITWARLQADGSTGPRHVVVIDLPQVALDPVQTGSGS